MEFIGSRAVTANNVPAGPYFSYRAVYTPGLRFGYA